MKLCLVLLQQHAGEMFVKHWKIQGKRILKDTGALRELNKRGITVIDAAQYIFPDKPKKPEVDLLSRLEPREIQANECLLYGDSNVLLGGLDQAKVLTNTVEPSPGCLPETLTLKNQQLPANIDDLVIKYLKNSLLYETEQKKLPKRKDPARPAWNFPRDYGVTDKRKNKLLCLRLVELCSKLSGSLPVIENGVFTVSLERQSLPVSLSLRSDALVLSNKRINPIASSTSAEDISLPDITPLLPTISIEMASVPQEQHPLTGGSQFGNIQVAISHFNETEVTNLYETPVTQEQFLGRSLLKAFTFAAAQARYLYGPEVVDLPKPIVIPSLHTDSQRFHFSLFQLNTLREDSKPRNLLFSLPVMHLYSECTYSEGVPQVTDFNPDVFKTLLAFYNL